MGVLIGTVGSGTDSARAARCLTNLKNLASACQTYGMDKGHFPLAGSVETMSVPRNGSQVEKEYRETPGWISWYSNGSYSSGKVASHVASSGWFASAYTTDADVREYCLTNGALWKYVSANRDLYVCPDHKIKFGKAAPAWSYVMNKYFRWAGSEASPKSAGYSGIGFSDLKRADRRLLFAEMPFVANDIVSTVNTSTGAGTASDCVLQYDDEIIGFNHKSGKKALSAHVVFADGHTEKLAWPRSGMTETQAKNLTKWLCEGTDFSFDGKVYKELD